MFLIRILYTVVFSAISFLAFGQFTSTAKSLPSIEDQSTLEDFKSYHFTSSADFKLHKVQPQGLFTKSKNKVISVDLLDHNGAKRKYTVQEVQNMMPGLAAKYPMIKTYRGHSSKNINERISITVNDEVVIARSHGHKENFLIQPVWNTSGLHAVSSVESAQKNFDSPVCHIVDDSEKVVSLKAEPKNKNAGIISLRTYRVAIAANGEYSALNGGTVQSVLTSIVGHLNLINEVFQREVGLTHLLVAENDQLIFLDSTTDPYDNDDNGEMMTMNTGIINGIIGSSAYDFGHIFGRGGGGVANLAVPCGARKGRGHSGLSGNADFFKLAGHEMGHQFSAGHVWSYCTTDLNGTQRSSASASEPGSGSTIMSYAGLCGSANVQSDDDPYYNAISIQQIKDFAFSGSGNNCSLDVTTSNNSPEVSIPYTDGFSIPISTPFRLEGSATDLDGDALTYNWDQFNFDSAQELGTIAGNSPAFRSMIPDTDPSRTFPRLSDILNNDFSSRTEILPDYSRNLTFRFLVRDNNAEVGSTVWQELSFNTTATAGPFTVTEVTEDYLAGVPQAVEWDVANTDNPIVNCQKVNVILSYDGGATFLDTLAKNTDNDGLEYVLFPNTTSTTARIKIEAVDNVFFDISNSNASIIEPVNPDFSLSLNTTSFDLCASGSAEVSIQNLSYLNFSELVTLNITDGLPTGASANFDTNPISANNTSNLVINNLDGIAPGEYSITVEASATGATTKSFVVNINLIDSNVSSPTLVTPVQGQIRVPIDINTSWSGVTGATSYQYQLATEPTFSNPFIDSTSIIIPQITLSNLNNNELYFWRARAVNQCGVSDYEETRSFYTKNQFCNTYSRQQSLTINDGTINQVVSTMTIDSSFTIQNFNIPYIRGSHDFVGDLEISLQSASGANSILIDNICDDSQDFDIGFNDEAVSLPICPISDGTIYRPQSSLSALNGVDGQGLYVLFVKDQNAKFGGEFLEWAIEFCDDLNPGKPVLAINELLSLKPMATEAISTTELQLTDIDTDDTGLEFILLTTPTKGTLDLNGTTGVIGSSFTQDQINAGLIKYINTSGEDGDSDSFNFVSTDGAGGLIENTTFNISLITNVPTIQILDSDQITIFPNPSNGKITLNVEDESLNITDIRIFNLQGQLVFTQPQQSRIVTGGIDINGTSLSTGIYQLSIFTPEGVITKKLAIQKQ